jgi:hypothetical protein
VDLAGRSTDESRQRPVARNSPASRPCSGSMRCWASSEACSTHAFRAGCRQRNMIWRKRSARLARSCTNSPRCSASTLSRAALSSSRYWLSGYSNDSICRFRLRACSSFGRGSSLLSLSPSQHGFRAGSGS